MTIAEMESMYRLLAIAKYEDRYVIPSAHRSRQCTVRELPGCSVDFTSTNGDSPVGEAKPVPVTIESFQPTKQRLEAEQYSDLDHKQ